MKKVLLVNQHSSNHGDEAAAKGLTSDIEFNRYTTSILYNTVNEKAKLDLGINFSKEMLTEEITFIEKMMIILTFIFPVSLIKFFYHGVIKKEFLMIEDNDFVISMPGGANMGLYTDWRYLWRLYVAIKMKKKVAIYSVSYGPFTNAFFKSKVKFVMSNVNFLSLRDAQSFRFADEMKLDYIKSIDTAFLRDGFIDKFDLADFGVNFNSKDYVVFVANDLTAGHLTFRNMEKSKVDSIYKDLIAELLSKDEKIVFLPQLFANGNDRAYFERLLIEMNEDSNENIVIVDESFSSDIQQNIVRNSKFVIGARYHSIIFSINNSIPFLCLSYENKMKNTLELLGYDSMGIDLTELANGAPTSTLTKKALGVVESLYDGEYKVSPDLAKKKASKCYESFKSDFLNI